MCVKGRVRYCGYTPEVSPHYSRRLLLQPPVGRCDKPTWGFQRILSGNEEQRTDLYWRFSRVVDIPAQQSLGDKVHDGLSIRGALATSRRNLAPVPLRSLPCERYTSHTIYCQLLHKEHPDAQSDR